MKQRSCRFCHCDDLHSFVDLGMSPLSNSYLTSQQLHEMEPFYPLHCFVCSSCFLVQLEEFESPSQIFGNYAYFSSYSETWLQHTRQYTDYIIHRLNLTKKSLVVEIASNDGYLLQNFLARDIPVLGIEPANNVAQVAIEQGIPTLVTFFTRDLALDLARQGKTADLIIGNNVLAHVPGLNDFVAGLKTLLKPQGVITLEFPHLMRLMAENQFDTIYHEHFSYFSFLAVEKIFGAHGLTLFDVEELPTHGGSLRIYGCHQEDMTKSIHPQIAELKERERAFGLGQLDVYLSFQEKVKKTKRQILSFLINEKEKGYQIIGYGAPAKGNTLLNYCGIRSDFLDYTVDRSPHKQGLFLPGTHIAIEPPEKINQTKPDYVFILPWNIKKEIMEQMSFIREWGGKFVVPIPGIMIF
jgi:SAM-dependent methyltransferase